MFISLVGALSSSCLALIFPPIIDYATNWEEMSARSTLSLRAILTGTKNLTILLLGVVGFFTGTYASIHSIVDSFALHWLTLYILYFVYISIVTKIFVHCIEFIKRIIPSQCFHFFLDIWTFHSSKTYKPLFQKYLDSDYSLSNNVLAWIVLRIILDAQSARRLKSIEKLFSTPIFSLFLIHGCVLYKFAPNTSSHYTNALYTRVRIIWPSWWKSKKYPWKNEIFFNFLVIFFQGFNPPLGDFWPLIHSMQKDNLRHLNNRQVNECLANLVSSNKLRLFSIFWSL